MRDLIANLLVFLIIFSLVLYFVWSNFELHWSIDILFIIITYVLVGLFTQNKLSGYVNTFLDKYFKD